MKKSTPFRSLSSFVAGLAALLTLAAHPAFGATKTWVGTTTDWGTAGNWSLSGVPATADDALFTSTGAGSVYLGSAARTINSITNNSTTGATPYTIFCRESAAVTTARRLTVGNMTVAAGNHLIKGNNVGSGASAEVVFNANSTLNVAAATTLTIEARLASSSSQNLIKSGNGTLVLKNDNGGTSSWNAGTTGFTVSAGTLDLAAHRASGSTGNKYIVSSGATMKLSHVTAWAGSAASSATLTLNGTGVSGVGALYASVTASVNGIAVNLAGDSRIGVDAAQVLTINAPITNTFALEKSGLGTLLLTGANSYSGLTAINAGKLAFSTAGSATTGVTVAGSATNGVLVAAANGQWVNTGSLTNANGSALEVDYGSTSPSTTTAPIQVSNFSVGTGLALRVAGVGFSQGQAYPLVTWTGTGPSDATAFTTVILPVAGNLTVSGNTLYLNVLTIPPLSWNTGSGGWDTTSFNWTNTILNVVTQYVDASDAVLFGDAAGATGNPVVTLANAFSPLSVKMNSSAHDYTISGSGSIGGIAPLILEAANTRTLTLATSNSYTGGTFISGGTLVLSAPGNLGSTAGVLFLSGGQLDLGGLTRTNGAVTISASAASGHTITNGTLNATSYAVNNAAGNPIISAILDGSGTFTKSGAGIVTLAGANTYTGNTTVSAGVLNLTGNRTADAGFTTVGSEGTAAELNISAGTFSIPTKMFVGVGVSSAGNGTVNHTAGAVTFGISNDQLLLGTGIGSGTYNLSGGSLTTLAKTSRGVMLGVNTGSSGTFNLSGTGSLSMAATSQLQIGRSDATGVHNTTNLFSQTGGTASVGILRIGGFSTTGSTNITATMTLTGGTFAATTFDRLAQGNNNTNTITIGGTADVTLPQFPQSGLGASSTAVINFNGGTLKNSAASANYLGVVTSALIKAGGAKFDTTGGDSTITHNLLEDGGSTGGGLTKLGTGTLTLSGANTYSGDTAVNAGTLALSGSGSIGSSPSITVAGPGTFDVSAVSGSFALGASQTLKGNGAVTGPITINGTLAAGTSIGTLTFSGAATNNGTLVMEITNGPSADKIIFNGSVHNLGGTLIVTNLGTLAFGTTYDLFDFTGGTPTGSFSTLNLPGLANHWNTSDLLIGGTITYTNSAPVAASFTNGVAVGGSATTEVVGKYVSDADGDSVTITVVSPPANGTASIVGGTNITYTSTNSAASDSFTYTVSDGFTTSTATVTVNTYSPVGFNKLSGPVNNGNGTFTLNYLGIPGLNYALDESPDLISPYTWFPVVTNAASGSGAIGYTVPLSYPSGSFRTRHVP